MSRAVGFATGLGVGAGMMFLLDPDLGNRRRKRVRDQLAHARRRSALVLGKASRDLAHRARGVVAEATAPLREQDVDDDVLVERVRARLGRLVSHPRAIEVEAHGGCVTLRGPVLRHEVNRLVRGTRAVRGVCDVNTQLQVHARAGQNPALQGGVARPGTALAFDTSPGGRLVLGIAGGLLALGAAQRRSAAALPVGLMGAALLGRSLTTRRRGVARGAVVVTKTLHVGAPVHVVFDAWSRYENFPRFMSQVVEVRDLGRRRPGLPEQLIQRRRLVLLALHDPRHPQLPHPVLHRRPAPATGADCHREPSLVTTFIHPH